MRSLCLIAVFLFSGTLAAQTVLRISTQKLGKVKAYEVFTGEVLNYKLKGDLRYRHGKISAMQDSTIVFTDEKQILLGQLKKVKLQKNVHIVGTLQGFFFGGAVLFLGLNTLNNVITDTSPVFSEKAFYISGGLLVGGVLVRQLGIKRIRNNHHTDLKILNLDFNHLSQDSTKTGN